MTLDDESKIIVQAIDKTLFDFKKYSDRIVNEEQIKLRLYQNICNMLGDDSFIYITGEYPVFTKVQQKENRDYATNHGRNKNYIDCIKKLPNLYKSKKTNKDIFDDIIKVGNYDLVIFDKNNKKINHVIEVKLLKKNEINPEMANRHRPLEDIFELTEFIKKTHINPSNKINDKCRGYNLMIIVNKNHDFIKNENMVKIKNFLKCIGKAYEDADIDYLLIGIDGSLIDKKNKLLELKEINYGKLIKYTSINRKK